jgi:hypothetical protein
MSMDFVAASYGNEMPVASCHRRCGGRKTLRSKWAALIALYLQFNGLPIANEEHTAGSV